MATVHRGKRLSNMRWKASAKFNDMAFNEGRITAWARANLRGAMHYDYVVFHGAKTCLAKEIELTAWFSNKSDFEAFEKEWSK